VLRDYTKGLLLRTDVAGGELDGESEQHFRMSEAIATLEREIFLAGYFKALGMGAGPCDLCETCDVDGLCCLPEQARPSMEACGIDVYTTVRQIGWKIDVVRTTKSPCRFFGLVLIE
jgi:predicted metal-binding protein